MLPSGPLARIFSGFLATGPDGIFLSQCARGPSGKAEKWLPFPRSRREHLT